MGCRHQTKIRMLLFPGTQWPELSAFQHPQQFGLQCHGHIANLIQKQGAAVGLGQQAFFGLVGTGEGTLGVTEQLTLQQGVRDGGTVDHHQRPTGTVGHIVNAPGHHIFATTGFALNQH